MKIRFIRPEDTQRLLEIYGPYIESTPISFETEVPSHAEFSKRIEDLIDTYPWLVAEKDGEIAGYAYASPHRSRCAYGWSADCSVYLDPKFQRQGIGRALYLKLFEILRRQGFFNVFAGITVPNPASESLHARMGFRKIGVYKNVGYKMDCWHDVAWYQLELGTEGLPEQPIKVTQLW